MSQLCPSLRFGLALRPNAQHQYAQAVVFSRLTRWRFVLVKCPHLIYGGGTPPLHSYFACGMTRNASTVIIRLPANSPPNSTLRDH